MTSYADSRKSAIALCYLKKASNMHPEKEKSDTLSLKKGGGKREGAGRERKISKNFREKKQAGSSTRKHSRGRERGKNPHPV